MDVASYWNFKNAIIQDNQINDVLNNQYGTLVNFVQSDIDDNGIAFDGLNKYVNLGSNSLNIGYDHTIESYFKINLGNPETNVSGESDNDMAGYSVSLSSDGSIIAIGAINNNGDDSNNESRGHVRVYINTDGSNWNQLGTDINGPNAFGYFGSSVALSADGSILAVGDWRDKGTRTFEDSVYVYQYSGSTWNQLGSSIVGGFSDTLSPSSVAIASNGLTVAIGSVNNDIYTGLLRVFSYTDSAWTLVGTHIDGKEYREHFGRSVALNADGTIVAVGASSYGINQTGTLRVYQYDGVATWTQMGSDIDGPAYSEFGWSCSLSADGTIVSIGGARYDSYNGIVRVYQYSSVDSSIDWTQVGQDIVGSTINDGGTFTLVGGDYTLFRGTYDSNALWNERVGWSCSLSADGKILVVGAINGDDGTALETGSAKVYVLDENMWKQSGETMYGDSYNERFAWAVSISSNGQHIAVGAPNFAESSIGIVKIFSLPGNTVFSLGDSQTNKLELTSDEFTSLKWITGGSVYDISTTNVFSDFSHIKITFYDEMSLYVDDSLVGSVDIPAFVEDISFQYNYLGANLSANDLLKGTMSYFTIHKRQYNDENAVFYNSYWNFKNAFIENHKLSDIISNQYATLIGFDISRSSNDGIVFDGTNKYVDLGENRLNFGNDHTIETNLKVSLESSEINSSYNWSQSGTNIDGESHHDMAGYSVSLSSDGSIIAIGAINNNGDDLNNESRGHVRVYRKTPANSWSQLGSDINGTNAFGYFGSSVALSADGSILAVGDWRDKGTRTFEDSIYIYRYSGSTWNQLGSSIVGGFSDTLSPSSIAIASNGLTVAIGSVNNNIYTGLLRVFSYTNSTWTLVGADIDGEEYREHFGRSVALNADGTIVAVGASSHGTNQTGTLRVYQYDGLTTWNQLGSDIDGPAYSEFGWSCSLSADGTIVSIGGARYDSYNGIVRVYQYSSVDSSIDWTQVGQDIVGSTINDGGTFTLTGGDYTLFRGTYDSNALWNERVGWSCSLSVNGNILVVGAINGDDGSALETGSAKVYYLENNTWIQLGQTLYGDSYNERFAWAVSISSNGRHVAVGAPNFAESSIGVVKIFSLPVNTIFSLGDSQTHKLELTSGEFTSLKWITEGSVYDISTTNVFSDFSHIKITFADEMSLFVDDSLVGAVDVPAFVEDISFQYNYLGSDLSNNNIFNGTMSYFTIYKNDYNSLDVSATAVFYISEADIQNVFKVRTTNVSNISFSDLLYFMHMDQWPADLILNPFNAQMNEPLSENAVLSFWNSNKMTVKHDYIRYLSEKIFNNKHCVSMFNNEKQLVDSLESMGDTFYQNNIRNVFWKFSTDSSHNQVGFMYDSVTGKNATTNRITTNDNICRQLMNTILQNAHSRLDNVQNIIDSNGVFPLPILQGDTISFETSLNPAENQHSLTFTNEFGGRSYKIKLVIT